MITEEDVKDTTRLARVIVRILKDVAALKRRFAPRCIDFEDRAVDNTYTTKYRLHHGFGGRVRWWVVDWRPSGGTFAFDLSRHADTDENTLVLVSGAAGSVTVRVEEAG